MSKKFIEYDADNNELKYTENDNKEIYNIKEPVIEEDNEINEIIQANKQNLNTNKSFKTKEELPDFKELNAKEKDFIENDYVFIDDTENKDKTNNKKKNMKEELNKTSFKNKKDNKKKKRNGTIPRIFNFLLKVFYIFMKFLFCLLLIFLVILLLYNYKKEIKETVTQDTKKVVYDIDTTEETTIEITIPTKTSLEEDKLFIKVCSEYVMTLNSVVEGDKLCINNLKNGKVTLKETNDYFSKSERTKKNLKEDFLKEIDNENYSQIISYIEQTFDLSINNSKQIENEYMISGSKEKAVSYFNSYYEKHLERVTEIQNSLGNI